MIAGHVLRHSFTVFHIDVQGLQYSKGTRLRAHGILKVLGPPCVAYARMGKQLRETDPSYEAHQNHYVMTKSESFDVQIIENVPEYSEEIVRRNLPARTWEVRSVVLDPRLFGQKASRPRRYFICWRRAAVTWDSPLTLEEVIKTLRTCPVMDPLQYFWKKLPAASLSEAQDP